MLDRDYAGWPHVCSISLKGAPSQLGPFARVPIARAQEALIAGTGPTVFLGTTHRLGSGLQPGFSARW
jgi:hypothetical protein